jgi:hypothetical protein
MISLVQAEARAAEGHRRLADQRKLVADLERDGRDAAEAKIDLTALEMLQQHTLAHFALIAEEIESTWVNAGKA